MKYSRDVIDSHYHIHTLYGGKDGEFWRNMEEYQSSRGFRAVNLAAMPLVDYDASQNMISALYKMKHPGTYAHGGLTYDTYPVPDKMPEGMDFLTQYKELMEIGFDGIKVLETKTAELKIMDRPICDEVYEEFFAAAERDQTHFIWHVADPETNWDREKILPEFIEAGWFYGDGTYPTQEEIFRQVYAVLDRHPKLNVTFAHFFFRSHFPEQLEAMFEKYPNVNVDLTPGREMYEAFGERRTYFRDFFTRYADRIEYGTDAHDVKPLEYNYMRSDIVYRFVTTDEVLEGWDYRFQGLKLDNDAADKILCGNFVRRVSEVPKPINKAALKAYIAKYRHLIRDEELRKRIDEEAARL